MKSEAQIKFAKKNKVKKMTFDCIDELDKIHKFYPGAQPVLRIATKFSDAKWNLNEKYGALIEDAPAILKRSKQLGINIKGVSFHCGTGGVSYESYESSLRSARQIFDMVDKMGLKKMDFLDIGGGFSCFAPNESGNFEYVAPKISALIDELFPEDIQIIGEPGTYICESVVYILSRIIGIKKF